MLIWNKKKQIYTKSNIINYEEILNCAKYEKL